MISQDERRHHSTLEDLNVALQTLFTVNERIFFVTRPIAAVLAEVSFAFQYSKSLQVPVQYVYEG